jgi:EAL domain-containing protein (putative c-di-GMP-specific phosphodiesterase class I)
MDGCVNDGACNNQPFPVVATFAIQAIVDAKTHNAVAHELLARDARSRVNDALYVIGRLNEAGRRRLLVEGIEYARALAQVFYDRQMHVNIDLGDLDLLNYVDNLSDVTIEILEGNVNLDKLAATIELIHSKGGLVAMDDYGSAAWPLNTPLDIGWDIIKLDRDVLNWSDSQCANLKKKIAGISVCLEGVEVESDLLIAERVGATLLQGYAYGMPVVLPSCAQVGFNELELTPLF